MPYILHTDKPEKFECNIQLEGASIKNSFARVILEVDGKNVLFKGQIDENGKCSVDISGLKSYFPKNCSGEMILEVVADDTYFSPWKDSVELKPSKSLTVEVISKPQEKSGPRLVVSEVKGSKSFSEKHKDIISEVRKIINSDQRFKKLSKDNIYKIISPILENYFSAIGEEYKKDILKEII